MCYLSGSFDGRVVEMLRTGGIGLIPTDTVYGLSASALDEVAVEELYALKQRDKAKPYIVLVSNIEQAEMVGLDSASLSFAAEFWPAPLSVIVSAQDAPEYLHRGTRKLAIRMPHNPDLQQLIASIGPVVSTSANIHGQPPVKNIAEALELFGDRLDFYVDAGQLHGQPSTIIEVTGQEFRVIRQGSWRMPNKNL